MYTLTLDYFASQTRNMGYKEILTKELANNLEEINYLKDLLLPKGITIKAVNGTVVITGISQPDCELVSDLYCDVDPMPINFMFEKEEDNNTLYVGDAESNNFFDLAYLSTLGRRGLLIKEIKNKPKVRLL